MTGGTPEVRRERRSLPDLLDWAENLPESLTWTNWPAPAGMRGIRVEEFLDEDGSFVARAELPGMDPDKDIDLEIDNGMLVIRAERREEKRERGRTEFRYGKFTRRLALPEGADESEVSARYTDGILEVRMPVSEKRPEARAIPVQRTG